MIKHCYFRVEANNIIGTGHLVRTEILADELKKDDIKINFICNNIPEDYRRKLLEKGYNIHRINSNESEYEQIIKIITSEHSLLVIDNDNEEFYTKEFQLRIKAQGIKLMIITFYNNFKFYCDILLNQNIMALSQEYDCSVHTKKLLGPRYVILENNYKEIYKNIDHYKTNKEKKTILITFGGVDKPDRTSFVYKALVMNKQHINKIIIVLGSMYQHKQKIEKLAREFKEKTEVYQNTTKMPFLFAESDIVFNSGGLTVWEGSVFSNLIVIMGHTEREILGGKFIGENNYGIYLGTKSDYDIKKLSNKISDILNRDNTLLIYRLEKEIDVNGVEKVVNVIKSL